MNDVDFGAVLIITIIFLIVISTIFYYGFKIRLSAASIMGLILALILFNWMYPPVNMHDKSSEVIFFYVLTQTIILLSIAIFFIILLLSLKRP